MKTTTDRIVAEKVGRVGWLTFNNPARRNAMSLDMWQAAGEALEDFEADPDVRVVVMKGAGDKAFVSGADISQFQEHRRDAAQAAIYAGVADGARRKMATLDKPLIAMIRGFCIGGGLDVASSADIRIASDDSQFGIPAARLGLAYGFGGLKRLVGLVGPAVAKEMLFTGRRMSAQEALRTGLVNRVVPAARLEDEVGSMALEIADNAPLTIRSSKVTIDAIMLDPADRDRDRVEASVRACFDSADYAEGREAFMEKRKPNFTGG